SPAGGGTGGGGWLAAGAPVDAALLGGEAAQGRLVDRGAAALARAVGAAEDPVHLAGADRAGEGALDAVAVGVDELHAAVDDGREVGVTHRGAGVEAREEEQFVDVLVTEAGQLA